KDGPLAHGWRLQVSLWESSGDSPPPSSLLVGERFDGGQPGRPVTSVLAQLGLQAVHLLLAQRVAPSWRSRRYIPALDFAFTCQCEIGEQTWPACSRIVGLASLDLAAQQGAGAAAPAGRTLRHRPRPGWLSPPMAQPTFHPGTSGK